jgi:hypothetical protein
VQLSVLDLLRKNASFSGFQCCKFFAHSAITFGNPGAPSVQSSANTPKNLYASCSGSHLRVTSWPQSQMMLKAFVYPDNEEIKTLEQA